MKRLVSGAVLAVLFAVTGVAMFPGEAAADCRRGNCWGAVAIGPGGAAAYAVNYPTRAIAGRAAMARCEGRCERTLTFRNSCGAYALGAGGRYGWGSHRNRATAQNIAMTQCRRATRGCRIRVWGCTTR